MNDGGKKRRLPVLGASGSESRRPVWQWALLGSLAALLAWSALALPILSRKRRALGELAGRPIDDPAFVDALASVPPDELARFGLVWSLVDIAALMLSVALGAWIVVRFGEPRQPNWAGTLTGLATTGFIVALSIVQSGLSLSLFVSVFFGAFAGFVGARMAHFGRKG